MTLDLLNQPFNFCENELNVLSERLRRNWLQKLNKFNTTDDSLTSLTWLYDMHPVGMELEAPQKFAELSSGHAVSGSIACSNTQQPFAGSLLDPQVRLDYRTKWTGKPPFSYATLICLAMMELGKPKVTLSDIYGWIMNNFAYYRHTDSSWQNSVRHNLSLNKCFEKVPRDKNERGKGGFWRVSPKHADWLEANLAKCRRAAPPPGPPPPIPRSMLLQQQLLQRSYPSQQNFTLTSNTYGLPGVVVSVAQTPKSEIGRCFGELANKSMGAALSPMSTSSTSPVSSSPHSFGSALSPVGSANQKLQMNRLAPIILPPLTTNHQLASPVDSELFPVFEQTRQAPGMPCAEVKYPQHVAPLRRRKSSVHRQNNIEYADFVDIDAVNLAGRKDTTSNKHDTSKERCDVRLNLKSASTCDVIPIERGNNSCRKFWYASSHQSYKMHHLSRSIESDQERTECVNKVRCTKAHRLLTLKRRMDGEQKKQEYSGMRERQRIVRSRRMGAESRVLPTRILPPRRRFSRWAHPRVRSSHCCIGDDNGKFRNRSRDAKMLADVTHNASKPGRRHGEKIVEGEWRDEVEDARTERGLILPLIDGIDDENADCIWPPPSNPEIEWVCRRSFTHQSEAYSPDASHWNSSFKNVTLKPVWPTPQYFPRAVSPASVGSASNQSSLFSVSSSYDSSSRCVHESSNCSDLHLYHTLPPSRHSTPRRVETQACKQIFPSEKPSGSASFGRLYPPPGEVEQYLGSSPQWAAVFLPEDKDNHLEQIYDEHSPANHSDGEVFGHLSSSVVPAETNYQAPMHHTSFTFGSEVTSDSSCDGQQQQDISRALDPSFQKQPEAADAAAQFSQSNSPLFDELDMDSARFDFDVLDGLVEASGPIPLDLDFSLTASFKGACSSLSNDSAVGSSSNSTATNGQSSELLSPTRWASSPSVSQELLSLPWFTESHSVQAANCLFSIFDNTEVDFEKPDQSTTDDGRLSTPPLHVRYET